MRRYTPEQIAEMLAGGSINPAELLPGPEGAHCGACGRFPEAWLNKQWKCRAADRRVSAASNACQRWRPASEAGERAPIVEAAIADAAAREARHLANEEAERARRACWSTHLLCCGEVVYVIDCGPYTKIGYTGGPVSDRMDGLRGANPYPLQLVALMPGKRSLERRLHKDFSRWRHQYEWFKFSPSSKARLLDRAQQQGGALYGAFSFRKIKGPLSGGPRHG